MAKKSARGARANSSAASTTPKDKSSDSSRQSSSLSDEDMSDQGLSGAVVRSALAELQARHMALQQMLGQDLSVQGLKETAESADASPEERSVAKLVLAYVEERQASEGRGATPTLASDMSARVGRALAEMQAQQQALERMWGQDLSVQDLKETAASADASPEERSVAKLVLAYVEERQASEGMATSETNSEAAQASEPLAPPLTSTTQESAEVVANMLTQTDFDRLLTHSYDIAPRLETLAQELRLEQGVAGAEVADKLDAVAAALREGDAGRAADAALELSSAVQALTPERPLATTLDVVTGKGQAIETTFLLTSPDAREATAALADLSRLAERVEGANPELAQTLRDSVPQSQALQTAVTAAHEFSHVNAKEYAEAPLTPGQRESAAEPLAELARELRAEQGPAAEKAAASMDTLAEGLRTGDAKLIESAQASLVANSAELAQGVARDTYNVLSETLPSVPDTSIAYMRTSEPTAEGREQHSLTPVDGASVAAESPQQRGERADAMDKVADAMDRLGSHVLAAAVRDVSDQVREGSAPGIEKSQQDLAATVERVFEAERALTDQALTKPDLQQEQLDRRLADEAEQGHEVEAEMSMGD